MKLTTSTILLVAALSVAGCTGANRFGDAGGAGGAGATAGVFDPALGDPTDPTSLAYFQQTVGDRVLFEVDQSTLTPAGQAVLDGQAIWMAANPDFSAVIEGHADEQGTREYNLALGERRANAVQAYLISQGVAGSRLTTVTYGKERPLEICSNESCYAQNRRAVTVLAAGAGV